MKKNTEADRERVFREYPVAKALRVMVVPAVVSQLIVLIYNMADTFYVGLTDNPYMIAGTSLILPVFNISLCLAGLAGVVSFHQAGDDYLVTFPDVADAPKMAADFRARLRGLENNIWNF